MLTLPDFNRLRVFYHVYSSGSILRAATDLHVTRSGGQSKSQVLEMD